MPNRLRSNSVVLEVRTNTFGLWIAFSGPRTWSVPTRAEIICAVAVPSRRALIAFVVRVLSSVGTQSSPVMKTGFSHMWEMYTPSQMKRSQMCIHICY